MHEIEVFEALKYRIEGDEDGTRGYYNSAGKLHRDDGPAIEYANGSKFWLQNGLLHRMDGPAVEWASGCKDWFINGTKMTEDEFNQAVKQND